MNPENLEASSKNNTNINHKYILRLDSIILIIFFIFAVSVFSYLNSNSQSDSNAEKSITPTLPSSINKLAENQGSAKQSLSPKEENIVLGFLNFKNQMIFPSPDNFRFFYVFPEYNNSNECFFGIVNQWGQSVDYEVKKILKTDKISCDYDYRYGHSSFIKWVDDYKVLLKTNDDSLSVIDVLNDKKENYPLQIDDMEFVDVNKSLKFWLYRRNDSFIIIDANKNIVYDKLKFDSDKKEINFRTVLYDQVNDGFLFISYKILDNSFETIFDYFNLNNLTFKNILTTTPFEVEGRGGCRSPALLPALGEVVIEPGCIAVDNKYISSDDKIHIKL